MPARLPSRERPTALHPAAPVLRAAAWAASLERSLAPLVPSRRTRVIHHGSRTAHLPGVDTSPHAAYFVNHKGSPLIGPDACPHVARTRSTASVVMVGGMAEASVRARAVYLHADTPLVMAVHEHPDTGPVTGLLQGVEIQRLVHGRLPVTVPRVLAADTVRVGGRDRAWQWPSRRRSDVAGPGVDGWADAVVEDWLPGTPVRLEDEHARSELLDAVAALWALEDTTTVPLSSADAERVGSRFARLVEEGHEWDLWPAELDPQEMARRVRSLLSREVRLTVGLSHGDPGLGNALRTDDGGLVLVDWEDAGHRVLSHDVLKVLSSAQVPGEHWAGHHPAVPRGGDARVLPGDQQLAVALLQFLVGWRNRTVRARRRRSLSAHRARTHRMLLALDGLLP